MLELETLLAFGIGAGLVALAPVVAAVAGRESKLTKGVTQTGRTLTKQGLKVGLVVADKAGEAVRGISHGLSEVGESFSDIIAEARADMAQAKDSKPTKISAAK